MSKHQTCKICHCDFVGPDTNINNNNCPDCDEVLHAECKDETIRITKKAGDWTIKENAHSVSVCWCEKVITQTLFSRIPKGEAIANANYIINSCNYYYQEALKKL